MYQGDLSAREKSQREEEKQGAEKALSASRWKACCSEWQSLARGRCRSIFIHGLGSFVAGDPHDLNYADASGACLLKAARVLETALFRSGAIRFRIGILLRGVLRARLSG